MNSETRVTVNSLLSFVSRAFSAGVSLFLVSFMLVRLGGQSYGLVGIITSVLAFIVLLEVGIRPAATRQFAHFYFSGDRERANALLSTALAWLIGLGVMIVAVGWLFGDQLLAALKVSAEVRPAGATALIFACAGIAASLITTPYAAALASQLRYDVQHLAQMGGSVLRVGVIVVGFSIWQPSLGVWGLAVFLAALLELLIVRWRAQRLCPALAISLGQISRRSLRDLLEATLYTSIGQVALWFQVQSGPLLIAYFLGEAQVSHYFPAMVVATLLQALSGSFLAQLQPVVTKAFVDERIESVRSILMRSTRYSLLLSGGGAAGLFCFAPDFVSAWLGPGFSDTAQVLRIWCVSVLLQASVGGAFSLYLGAGQFPKVAGQEILFAAISVGTAMLLLESGTIGVAGVAIGILAAHAARSVLRIRGSSRIAGLGASEYFNSSYRGPAICIAGLVCSALLLKTLVHGSPLYSLIAAGVPSFVLYAGLSWFLGLNASDRERALAYARAALRYGRGGSGSPQER